MRTFNSPLDNIRIASPCSADWNEMFGDDRRRHCADCKLNVYNLSDMTRREAENLLINSEGRLCVRFYRRADGTVLTANCPVGWRAVKQRVSRVATAAFSAVAGLITGIVGYNVLHREDPVYLGKISTNVEVEPTFEYQAIPLPYKENLNIDPGIYANGRMTLGKPVIVIKPNAPVKLERKLK